MSYKYNFLKLKGKIKEKGMTLNEFANHIGISEQTLYKRFNGKSYFTQIEIEKAMKLFDETLNHVQFYFFTQEVAKNKTN